MQDSKTQLGALTQYTNIPHWLMEERLPITLVVNTPKPKPKPFPPSRTPPTQNSPLLLQQLTLPPLLQLFLVTKLLPWNAQELIFWSSPTTQIHHLLMLKIYHYYHYYDLLLQSLLPVGYSRTHFEAHPLHKYFMSWWWRYTTTTNTTTTTTTTIITAISCDKDASHGMLKNSFWSSPTNMNMSSLDSEERLLTLWSMLQTIYFCWSVNSPPPQNLNQKGKWMPIKELLPGTIPNNSIFSIIFFCFSSSFTRVATCKEEVWSKKQNKLRVLSSN